MDKPAFALLVLCTSLITMPMVYGMFEVPKEADQWLQKLTEYQEKVTHLSFYLHNVGNSSNPTVEVVAQSSATNKSKTFFGALFIMDDLLTKGPEPTSEPVGRAQGIVATCSLTEVVYCMTFNFVFTSGKFNGSSLAITGRNMDNNLTREMTIVGGTGAFRLARGFIATKTYDFNTETNNGIYEYNVVAIHF